MNEELANRLIAVLSDTSSAVITEYTHYFIYTSLFHVFVGIVFSVIAWRFKKPESWDDDNAALLKGVLFLVSFVIIMVNAGDIISPQAMAIHQLIKDIKS